MASAVVALTHSSEFQRALEIARVARRRTVARSTLGEHARDWATLPEPLLTAVFQNTVLSTKDKIRASLVCGAWCVAALLCPDAWTTIEVVPGPSWSRSGAAVARSSRFFGHVAETMDLRRLGVNAYRQDEPANPNPNLHHAAFGPSVTSVLLSPQCVVDEVLQEPQDGAPPTQTLRSGPCELRLRDVRGGPVACELLARVHTDPLTVADGQPMEWRMPEDAVVRSVNHPYGEKVWAVLLDPADPVHASLLAHVRLAVHCVGQQLQFRLKNRVALLGPLFDTTDAPGAVALILSSARAGERPKAFKLAFPYEEMYDSRLQRFVRGMSAYVAMHRFSWNVPIYITY